jgi:predicted O-linked N-acetylglucosamine transferase (SPINDLY family)
MTAAIVESSRNAPCHCGSGKRYKDCHGAVGRSAAQCVEQALAQMRARDFTAAEANLQEARRLAPGDARVYANLGTLYVHQRRYADAEEPLARALALAPDHAYALTLLAHARQSRCAWAGLDGLHERIRRAIDRAGEEPASVCDPFPLLSMPTTPQQQLVAANRYARTFAPGSPASAPSVDFAPGERLRVGFASTDFRRHATSVLMLEFWERIDRSRLEVFAYGLLARGSGGMARRAENAFEHFVDLSAESDERAAQRIREDRIGILLDLNGYTRSARPGIFAFRPAPLQVNTIGFQATLGAPWYDYILTDHWSMPERLVPFFAEQPLYLPGMLYPSDTSRLREGSAPSRGECGLPPSGFVFCCFNNTYKILPEVFAIWMRLLHAIPGAVLWLLDTDAEAKSSLRREAQTANVDPNRLVFAPLVKLEDHVARNATADLFVDTFPYGAHTTANDALLAGLPVLTRAGETLASRIAGSQLDAIGLPELATESFEQYEARALELTRDRDLLKRYRDRLAANRHTHPLFDMARYTRGFEDAMLELWARHAAA